jgi:hypothetical protein
MITCREWFKTRYGHYPEELDNGWNKFPLTFLFSDLQEAWNAALDAAGEVLQEKEPGADAILAAARGDPEFAGLDLFGICKRVLEEIPLGGNVEPQDLIWDLQERELFASLPKVHGVKKMGGGEEGLSFENVKLIGLTKEKMTLVAWGDWQVAVKFSVSVKDGLLYYNNDADEDEDSTSAEDLNGEAMLKILYGTERPEELKGRYFSWPEHGPEEI